tara:strand:- start:350 stop:826 length:477 start_codon:yes stop_codon:yes gene_type:complete
MPGVDSATSMPPDPEIVLRTWLLSKSTITNEISQRVATKLPQNPTLPFVVIENQGNLLSDPASQAPINIATLAIYVYAGRWGGDGTKPEPDYSTASNIAQIIYKELFTESRVEVLSNGGVNAVIYGFEIAVAPVRIENRERQIAEFQITANMTYRYTA